LDGASGQRLLIDINHGWTRRNGCREVAGAIGRHQQCRPHAGGNDDGDTGHSFIGGGAAILILIQEDNPSQRAEQQLIVISRLVVRRIRVRAPAPGDRGRIG